MQLFFKLFLLLMLVGLSGCVEDGQSPDPVLQDYPIAYVKRPLYDADGNAIPLTGRDWLTFRPGGDLFLRDRASPSAEEHNLTYATTLGQGDVRDLEVSHDGIKLIFSLRMPEVEDAPPEEQPTWNIWEYNLKSAQLRRIISSDIIAAQGQDIAPAYLPDGRIVFSSTRQRDAGRLLLDEGKPMFSGIDESRRENAAVLHVMESDGSNIQQISFNPSHDYDPSVLMDGRILFSRWDNMGTQNGVRLYTIRPDGTELQIYYGAHSAQVGHGNTVTDYMQPREMENGQILATQVSRGQNNVGGDLVVIDGKNYIDYDQPTALNQGVLNGPGQWPATVLGVDLQGETLSLGGLFVSAYPLWDGTPRILTSWTPCRVVVNGLRRECEAEHLNNPGIEVADPLFGLYVYDLSNHTMRPVLLGQEGVVIADVVTLRGRKRPFIFSDGVAGDGRIDRDLYDAGLGLLHIRSVYDMDGAVHPDLTQAGLIIEDLADPMQFTADERPVRFVKVIKSVAIPDDTVLDFDRAAFGVTSAAMMREILGYAMVEPDGSVLLEVPANLAFSLSFLDKQGQRVSRRHQMWLQLRPGETLECVGCHDHNEGISHGRSDGVAAVYSGAATSGLSFPNTDSGLVAEMGETMAQTRGRISCETDCVARKLTADVIFDDVWTDQTQRQPDPPFSYRYTSLDSTLSAPATTACQQSWSSLCRTIIHYPQHIHPLWSLPRSDAAMNDRTCTACHTDTDSQGMLQVPAGQLQLDGGASPEEAMHLISYRELLFSDFAQELRDGALQDILQQATDGDGNLLFETDGQGNLIPIMESVDAPGPSMSPQGANVGYFLSLFEAGSGDAIHEGLLTPIEMRLIAEWLDLGAQYYNNPYDVPLE